MKYLRTYETYEELFKDHDKRFKKKVIVEINKEFDICKKVTNDMKIEYKRKTGNDLFYPDFDADFIMNSIKTFFNGKMGWGPDAYDFESKVDPRYKSEEWTWFDDFGDNDYTANGRLFSGTNAKGEKILGITRPKEHIKPIIVEYFEPIIINELENNVGLYDRNKEYLKQLENRVGIKIPDYLKRGSKSGLLNFTKFVKEQLTEPVPNSRMVNILKTNDIRQLDNFIEYEGINSQSFIGWTLLMNACDSNNFDMVKYLVDKGADLEIMSTKNDAEILKYATALLIAIERKNNGIAKYLINKGAKVINNKDFNMSPMRWACKNANAEMVEYIMSNAISQINSDNFEEFLEIALNNRNSLQRQLKYISDKGKKEYRESMIKLYDKILLTITSYILKDPAFISIAVPYLTDKQKEKYKDLVRSDNSGMWGLLKK